MTTPVTPAARRRRPALLVAHAALVVVAAVLFAVLAAQPTEDANIGAGLALLPLLVLGLPWSVPLLGAPDLDALPAAVRLLVLVAPAFVNVVLHAALRAWLLRRRARHAPA